MADAPALPLTELLRSAVAKQRKAPPRVVSVNRPLAESLARFAEWFHAPFPGWPPIINRYRVAMLSRSHSFRVDRMVHELGVVPRDARRWLSNDLREAPSGPLRLAARTGP